MALIDCPDCATRISDQAAACPQCARPILVAAEPVQEADDSSDWGAYFLGYFLALIIFAVKYGLANGIIIGPFVAILSWFYVAFALIQAIFT